MNNVLSHTGVNTFLECSEKWRLHYQMRYRPVKIQSPLIFGGAIDKGLNELLESKDLNKAIKVFVKEWKRQTINGVETDLFKSNMINYLKSDLDNDLLGLTKYQSRNPQWTSLLRKGKLFLKYYNQDIIPRIKKVVKVQEKISSKTPDGDEITGFIDAIVEWEDGKTYIIDNKTTTAKYKDDSASTSNQLTLYHFVMKDNLKIDGVAFVVLNKTIKKYKVKICEKCGKDLSGTSNRTCNNMIDKKRCDGTFNTAVHLEVETNFIPGNISEDQENLVLDLFDQVNNQIHSKKFEKNFNSCRGKFGMCVFYNLCHYDRTDDLVQLEAR